MSMYRQLWLAIMISTFIALAGSFLASTLSSRAYLKEQLRMKNADNATVLALSLSQKNIDPVDLDLAISAVFDGGHYANIRVTDPSGKKLVERTAPIEKSNVPSWFIDFFPIVSPPGQAQISSGWKQIGSISLESQSGFAYQALWNSTREMIAALGIAGLIAGYLGTLVLRRIKQPLSAVVEQAIAMRERRFIIAPESQVPELRQLSTSMNATVTLLKSMFAEEAERLQGLRRQANTDPVTGLANRAHFMAQLHVMVEDENAPPGNLIIVRLSHLGEINRQLGHNKADALLKQIASIITSQSHDLSDVFTARLNGTDFALLFREAAPDPVVQDLLQSLMNALARIDNNPSSVFIGYSRFEYGIAPGSLLAQVDEAVARAEINGNSNGQQAAPLNIDQAPRSAEEWAGLIHRALEQRWVKLALFPVADFSGNLIHREAALRLMFGGEWFPAGRFLPIAERLGITAKLDLAAVTLALHELAHDSAHTDVAVNISAQSIQDADFRSNLRALLLSKPEISKRLWIEIPENGVLANVDAFRVFYEDISRSGCKIGLEHFGKQLDRISLIYDLKLDYIKIDGSFIHNIDINPGNQAFVKGVSNIAHRMGLQLFAESVNLEGELKALAALQLDGATGPAVGKAFEL